MTVYDKIKELSFDEMAEFLFTFAKETIDLFANFQIPTKEGMIEFLEREKGGDQRDGT